MTRNKTKTTPTDPDTTAAPGTTEVDSSGETGAAPAAAAKPAEERPAEGAPEAPAAVALQQALEASKGQYVRLLADFDNFRKRVARERTETIRHASEKIVTELLPVLDHFELALRQAPDPAEAFVAGIRMVYDQLIATLTKAGLAVIDAQGAPFNPDEHEAIAYQPADGVAEGHVMLQTRGGYRLGDRVIRPATVIVSSGAPPPPEASDAQPGEGDEAADDPVPVS